MYLLQDITKFLSVIFNIVQHSNYNGKITSPIPSSTSLVSRWNSWGCIRATRNQIAEKEICLSTQSAGAVEYVGWIFAEGERALFQLVSRIWH